jgi:lysophospholipase L1-like esterase
MQNRRKFLQNGLLTVGTALTSTSLLKAAETNHIAPAKISIKQNDIILFQGDSITDHSRAKDNPAANNLDALGRGYASVAAGALLNKFAAKDIKVYNRGISGNKVPQLDSRWQEDCIDLKPNILSMLIGVNDYWHKRGGNYEGSAELYHDQYRKLLDRTLQALPNVKLIIGEPFAVKNVRHVDDSWFPEFASYQEAAQDIAKEYNAILIPYQSIFDNAGKKAPGSHWTTDGVHTTPAGINLMAEAWLNCVK